MSVAALPCAPVRLCFFLEFFALWVDLFRVVLLLVSLESVRVSEPDCAIALEPSSRNAVSAVPMRRDVIPLGRAVSVPDPMSFIFRHLYRGRAPRWESDEVTNAGYSSKRSVRYLAPGQLSVSRAAQIQ